MLAVKSCVELLRSCGINILVVFSDIPAFCLDYKLPTTKNIRTRNKVLCFFLGFFHLVMPKVATLQKLI